jgi:hypothetical protein
MSITLPASFPARSICLCNELLFERLGSFPHLEIGFGELEDTKATILLSCTLQVEFAAALIVQLLDDATNTLLVMSAAVLVQVLLSRSQTSRQTSCLAFKRSRK